MSFLPPILSGILLGAGFIAPFLNFLSWIALIPLLFFVEHENSKRKIFLAGFITGFIFLGMAVWLFDLLPLNYLGINNNILGFLILFFSWVAVASVLASFIGLFSLGYSLLKRNWKWDILLIPCLWIIFEYLRSWSFSIFLAGKETLFGPHWTIGNLAYSLAQNPSVRFLASIGGIYLVSFLVVFLNFSFFFLIKRIIKEKIVLNRIIYFLIILAISGLISISYFPPHFFPQKTNEERNKTIETTVLQTKFSPFFNQTKESVKQEFQTKLQLLKDTASFFPNSKIIVFPEDSRFLKQKNSKELLTEIFQDKEILLIDSSRTETPDGIKSITTFYDIQKGVITDYEKLLLAPTGEYLPYIFRIPAWFIDRDWVGKFEKSRGYKKGKEMVIFSTPKDWKGGAFLCSEIFSPELHRKMTNQGAEVLFNLGSLSFAHGSKIFDLQAQTTLQFRAAENNRYLVRATNFGTSYIIDNGGKIVKKTPDFENQVLYGKVAPISKKTFYTKFGDWILIFALGIVILTILLKTDIISKRSKIRSSKIS